jgi:hypothetical protein
LSSCSSSLAAVGPSDGAQEQSLAGSSLEWRLSIRALRGFGIVVLTIAPASAWGCGSTATKEGTGEYGDDSVITTEVKAAIFNDSSLKVNEINVETWSS